MSEQTISLNKKIPATCAGMRLDAALSTLFPEYSRAQLVKWLKAEQITVDGAIVKAKFKVKGYEQILLNCQPSVETPLLPQQGDLNIVYEDDDLLIINKQANWIVHPGAGNPDNTVVNALLYYHEPLNLLPRAGIIHRLDKDTTGLLIVAKTLTSFNALVKMMQEREIQRFYQAITYGEMESDLIIDAPIGRHPSQRTKMAVTTQGKHAVTHVFVEQYYDALTHIRLKLETGRTHQIRVHLTHAGFPLIGDPVYQDKNKQRQAESFLDMTFDDFNRQALHAYRLEFIQPISQQAIEIEIPLPQDMLQLLDKIAPFSFAYEAD